MKIRVNVSRAHNAWLKTQQKCFAGCVLQHVYTT